MQVENIPYSFVQMQDPATEPISPCDGSDFSVISGTDAIFQFVVVADNATELQAFLSNHPIRLYYNGSLVTTAINWKFLDLGNNRVLIYVPSTGVPGIANIADGTCFRFVFIYDATNIGPYSNCFIKDSTIKSTSLLQYSNTVNQNGFYYCDAPGYQNSIRLPMQVIDVAYENTSNIYKFSNGTPKKTAERINRIWTFQTDWLPIQTLDALQAALNSRTVNVTSDLYTGGIVSNSVIQPEISDTINDMRKTPRATFTAYETPYSMQLNSCATCD